MRPLKTARFCLRCSSSLTNLIWIEAFLLRLPRPAHSRCRATVAPPALLGAVVASLIGCGITGGIRNIQR
jgi:hypothetical protein